MCLKSSPFHQQSRSRRRQNGAGLPMAIFLITVMVLIVATIARLQQSAAEAEALDIQSARALYAAESGLQAHFADIFPDEEDDSVPCEENDFDFGTSGLSGCSAEVRCVQGEEEGEPRSRVFESRGQCGSGPDRAVRKVEVRAQ